MYNNVYAAQWPLNNNDHQRTVINNAQLTLKRDITPNMIYNNY